MLKTHTEVVKYVKETIKSGNKERIQKVMKRYKEYINERKQKQENLVETAKVIFNEPV